MNRVIGFFKSLSSAMLLFHLGVLAFSWPLLSISAEGGGVAVFRYIFIVWAVVVVLLMVTGFAIRRATDADRKD